MSWDCPHESRYHCTKRDAPCLPGTPGCCLEGRIFRTPRSTPAKPRAETSSANATGAVPATPTEDAHPNTV